MSNIENHMVIFEEDDYNKLYGYNTMDENEEMEEEIMPANDYDLDEDELKEFEKCKKEVADGRDDATVMLRNSQSNEIQSREAWIVDYIEGGALYKDDQTIKEFLAPLKEVQ